MNKVIVVSEQHLIEIEEINKALTSCGLAEMYNDKLQLIAYELEFNYIFKKFIAGKKLFVFEGNYNSQKKRFVMFCDYDEFNDAEYEFEFGFDENNNIEIYCQFDDYLECKLHQNKTTIYVDSLTTPGKLNYDSTKFYYVEDEYESVKNNRIINNGTVRYESTIDIKREFNVLELRKIF